MIKEGYNTLDELSNQIKIAVEKIGNIEQHHVDCDDIVKFYHDERDRFRSRADSATLMLQEFVILGALTWDQIGEVYSQRNSGLVLVKIRPSMALFCSVIVSRSSDFRSNQVITILCNVILELAIGQF